MNPAATAVASLPAVSGLGRRHLRSGLLGIPTRRHIGKARRGNHPR